MSLTLKLKEVQFPILVCLSDRQGFQVGSLSHMINLKAVGYQELPEFPEVAPDPSVRNVEVSLFVMTFKNFVLSSRFSSWSYLTVLHVRFWSGAICCLSLLLVLALLQGFSLGTLVFHPPQKPTSLNSNLSRKEDLQENQRRLMWLPKINVQMCCRLLTKLFFSIHIDQFCGRCHLGYTISEIP